jgi:hypothetical protein
MVKAFVGDRTPDHDGLSEEQLQPALVESPIADENALSRSLKTAPPPR